MNNYSQKPKKMQLQKGPARRFFIERGIILGKNRLPRIALPERLISLHDDFFKKRIVKQQTERSTRCALCDGQHRTRKLLNMDRPLSFSFCRQVIQKTCLTVYNLLQPAFCMGNRYRAILLRNKIFQTARLKKTRQ